MCICHFTPIIKQTQKHIVWLLQCYSPSIWIKWYLFQCALERHTWNYNQLKHPAPPLKHLSETHFVYVSVKPLENMKRWVESTMSPPITCQNIGIINLKFWKLPKELAALNNLLGLSVYHLRFLVSHFTALGAREKDLNKHILKYIDKYTRNGQEGRSLWKPKIEFVSYIITAVVTGVVGVYIQRYRRPHKYQDTRV